MRHLLVGISLCILSTACVEEEQQIIPIPFNQVPFSVYQSAPAVERFRRCAAFRAGKPTELPETHRFISSDLYKVMEGVAYSLMIQPDEKLEKFMDDVTELIAASQQEDQGERR